MIAGVLDKTSQHQLYCGVKLETALDQHFKLQVASSLSTIITKWQNYCNHIHCKCAMGEPATR